MLEVEPDALGIAADLLGTQVVNKDEDGVDGALGGRRMGADALGSDLREAIAGGLDRDAVGRGKLGGVSLDDRSRLAGDRVACGAAVQLDDLVGDGGGGADRGGVAALLAADHGEVRVRGEEEGGLLKVIEIPLDIAHVGLFVVADNHAEGIGVDRAGLLGALLEELERIKAEGEGALIIEDAAADHEAVLACDLEGREGPAGALGDDVGVADEGNLLVGRALDIGIADVAVAVMGVEAQAVGDLDRRVERLEGLGAIGLARFGRIHILHGADVYQRVDIGNDILPLALDVLARLLLELLVCHKASFLTRSRTLHDSASLTYDDTGLKQFDRR